MLTDKFLDRMLQIIIGLLVVSLVAMSVYKVSDVRISAPELEQKEKQLVAEIHAYKHELKAANELLAAERIKSDKKQALYEQLRNVLDTRLEIEKQINLKFRGLLLSKGIITTAGGAVLESTR